MCNPCGMINRLPPQLSNNSPLFALIFTIVFSEIVVSGNGFDHTLVPV